MHIQSYAQFLISNWVLISFLSALVIAAYVKFRFGVDYFESYRNISTTKELSKFHEQIGDHLMASSEWVAAELAYRAALQVNPNNSRATFGIVKAQVFQPLPGQKYCVPEVVDVRLDVLLSRFPDDYQVCYLKAIRCQQIGDNAEAKSWIDRCISKNPAFIGSYLLLGGIHYADSDIEGAADNFRKAVELDRNSAVAKNNLAACHTLLQDFPAAVKQFQDSYRISPSTVTAVSLGEAYWYSGEFDSALDLHQCALDYIRKAGDVEDRYIGSSWTTAYLPLRHGDLETIKNWVRFSTPEQKKALLHFELCIDHALLGSLDAATREFDAGSKLEQASVFRRIFGNRMQSAENLVKMPDATRAWLAERRKSLES